MLSEALRSPDTLTVGTARSELEPAVGQDRGWLLGMPAFMRPIALARLPR